VFRKIGAQTGPHSGRNEGCIVAEKAKGRNRCSTIAKKGRVSFSLAAGDARSIGATGHHTYTATPRRKRARFPARLPELDGRSGVVRCVG
jgi:hypothetical protein